MLFFDVLKKVRHIFVKLIVLSEISIKRFHT